MRSDAKENAWSKSGSIVERPSTATSLQQPLFLVPEDSPYIHSYLNLSTTATGGGGGGRWGRGGLMVSALDSGASAPGSSPGRGHCVVFLGKTLHSHSSSLHPGV